MVSLRRITSSGNFIPEIDGIRFFAIMSVVMLHMTTFITDKDTHIYLDTTNYDLLKGFGWKGFFGVQLFFVISGFILALPFARMHFKHAEAVNIKNYLLRRLTRLEPPYIIVITVLLFASIFIVKKIEPSNAITSYCSSLFYIHNFVYGKGTLPLLNYVTWSLEIEVQFYLLAPLLSYIFKVKNALTRRIILCSCILLFTLISQWLPFRFISIINYIQYFLTGFLLADFYLLKPAQQPAKNISYEILGILCLAGMWTFNEKALETKTVAMTWQLTQLIMVFVLYYLVLVEGRCVWIRANFFTYIGGMCYSIYLIHSPIISLFGNKLINRTFSDYSYINLGIIIGLLLLAVFIFSGVFYLLIERPCMDKYWPKKLAARIKSLFIPAN